MERHYSCQDLLFFHSGNNHCHFYKQLLSVSIEKSFSLNKIYGEFADRRIWFQMFHVHTYLITLYPFTVHLGFRSSVRCQRGLADAGICVESTASGQPNFSPWKEKRHSAAGKHYRGSWPIRGHKIHHWPCVSGRIGSNLPLLRFCWDRAAEGQAAANCSWSLLRSTTSRQYRAGKPGRELESLFWFSLSHLQKNGKYTISVDGRQTWGQLCSPVQNISH